jgi:hypothetical protein
MTRHNGVKILLAGAGGFVGNGVLGAFFSSASVRNLLYKPELQSRFFIELTPQRDVGISVADLVVLSAFTMAVQCPHAAEVRFDGARLPGGEYFYRLHARDFVQTCKLILLT